MADGSEKSAGTINSSILSLDLNPDRVRIKGYKIGERIAGGAHGEIHRARKKEAKGVNKDYAVKVIRYDQVNADWKESRLKDELKISKHLQHPNIMKFHDIIKTTRRAFLFMDLAKGNLQDIIKDHHDQVKASPTSKSTLTETEVKKLFKPIVEAVVYMHTKGVAHRGKISNDQDLVNGYTFWSTGSSRFEPGQYSDRLEGKPTNNWFRDGLFYIRKKYQST